MRTYVASVALLASFASGAVAAPKPVCNLVTDAANDVSMEVSGQKAPYPDSAVDIRSADVVADAQGIGVTLRLGSIGGTSASSTRTDLGMLFIDYKVFFTIESMAREVIFQAQGPADNASGVAWTAANGQWSFKVGRYLNDDFYSYEDEFFIGYGDAKGVVDTAKSELRLSVTWAELGKYGYKRAKRDRAIKVRARVADIWFATTKNDGDPYDPANARYTGAPRDEAATKAAYQIGAKTCTTRA